MGTQADPFQTIGAGITAALDGDTIWVVGYSDDAYTGVGNRDLAISGKAITIKSTNGPENCIIDCYDPLSYSHRAFTISVDANETVNIEGIQIKNAFWTLEHGGAVYAEGAGSLIFRDCVFADNKAGYGKYGGAIYNDQLKYGALINCEFYNNISNKGGAVASNNYYLHSGNDYLITNCTFVHNIADDFAGAVDGCDNHKATLLNCRFNGNLSSNGGAMSCGYGCEMTLINNTFCGNRATSYGGALHVNHESEAYVINCILWGDEVYDNNPVHGNEVAVIDDSTLEISYSVLAGGYSDAFIGPDSLLIINSSVIDYDPHYIAEGSWTGGNQYNWYDSAWMWNDGCYELTSFLSSLYVIHTGYKASVPLDIYDVDGDDDYDEPTPDLSHHDRIAQCYVDMGAYEYTIIGDILPDGHVDLSDLATLLSKYGMTGATYWDGDLNCDGVVNLDDLAEMLGRYGSTREMFAMRALGGGLETESDAVTLEVAAVDTNSYTSGGFVGEVEHFVFDVIINVTNPSNDDWLVGGAALSSSNDAEFRLSTQPTAPDAYATFAAAPWTSLPGSSTANLAGSYQPASSNYVFETGEINLGWYDTNTASHDGPATILRVVIDVSAVAGADVSTGFGSVYFSGKGPKSAGDIPVAAFLAGAATVESLPDLATRVGCFYVKGQ